MTGHAGESGKIISWLWGRCLGQDSVVPECWAAPGSPSRRASLDVCRLTPGGALCWWSAIQPASWEQDINVLMAWKIGGKGIFQPWKEKGPGEPVGVRTEAEAEEEANTDRKDVGWAGVACVPKNGSNWDAVGDLNSGPQRGGGAQATTGPAQPC